MLKQILTTLLVRTRNIHLSLIDMKGGIDFQEFHGLPNFEIVTKYEDADRMLGYLNRLYEKRTQIILAQKKENWSQVNTSKLKESAGQAGEPLGPVVLVVDELAELSRKATQSAAHSKLQEKIAHLARLARVTGIHLILGTQRPDSEVLAGQSRDNLPTKVCYSVPSIHASSIVLGNMTAFTLGGHPGRAVVVAGGTTILQTPYITRAEVDRRLGPLREQAKGQKTAIKLARFQAEEKPAAAPETISPGTEARPTRSPVDDFGVIHEK
jgi:S-DNA-T family DNA segregation ATPase FtsK/SpoIIIE